MIRLPFSAKTTYEDLKLPSNEVFLIRSEQLLFPSWFGEQPISDWGGKPIVGPPEMPFAELAIAAHLRTRGYVATWVYRSAKFLGSWEPRDYVQMPDEAVDLYRLISDHVGNSSGCWDIFAWKDASPLFIEVK